MIDVPAPVDRIVRLSAADRSLILRLLDREWLRLDEERHEGPTHRQTDLMEQQQAIEDLQGRLK